MKTQLLSDYHKISLYGIEKPMRERYPLWWEYKQKQWERGRFDREHKKRNTGKIRISFSGEKRKAKKVSNVNITWR